MLSTAFGFINQKHEACCKPLGTLVSIHYVISFFPSKQTPGTWLTLLYCNILQ